MRPGWEDILCLPSLSLKYKPRKQKQRPSNKPFHRDSAALHAQAQKWGSRRGPPLPAALIRLPAGVPRRTHSSPGPPTWLRAGPCAAPRQGPGGPIAAPRPVQGPRVPASHSGRPGERWGWPRPQEANPAPWPTGRAHGVQRGPPTRGPPPSTRVPPLRRGRVGGSPRPRAPCGPQVKVADWTALAPGSTSFLLCPRPAGAPPGESRPAIAGTFQTSWVLLPRVLY